MIGHKLSRLTSLFKHYKPRPRVFYVTEVDFCFDRDSRSVLRAGNPIDRSCIFGHEVVQPGSRDRMPMRTSPTLSTEIRWRHQWERDRWRCHRPPLEVEADSNNFRLRRRWATRQHRQRVVAMGRLWSERRVWNEIFEGVSGHDEDWREQDA